RRPRRKSSLSRKRRNQRTRIRRRRRWSAWTRSAAARRRTDQFDRHNRNRRMNAPLARPSGFLYSPMFPLGPDHTPWKKLAISGVSTLTCDGRTVLRSEPDALSELAFQAYRDVSHLLRPGHLQQLRAILDDPEASDNDRFV